MMDEPKTSTNKRQGYIRLTILAAVALVLSSCQIQESNQDVSALIQANSIDRHYPGWLTTPSETQQVAAQATPLSTPIPAVPKLLPPPDLWQLMRKGMRMHKHLDQVRVQQEIRWLKRHPKYFLRLQSRIQRYMPYILKEVQLRGIPTEIALLPIVESALDPFAFSHGGAAGPWQFIRGTARQYGLSINDWYDGRRDIIASTNAALNYLTYLEKRFGDWNLALAGYNAGQGNVSKALRRKPDAGFFDLNLPRETKAYVPRLLALAAVIDNPKNFGIELPVIQPRQSFTTVNVHSQFQISKVAQASGLSEKQLYEWNPALNQWATPPLGPHRIILPVDIDLQATQVAIDATPANQRVDWTEIVVRPGDTLSQIARRHNTDITALQIANKLHGSRIRSGKKLLIPTSAQTMNHTPHRNSVMETYVVKPGDSLWTIARLHKVKLNNLMRHNHLGPKDTLSVGKKLSIPGTGKVRKVVRKVRYKVRSGDSLARIANKFNVTVSQITNWNRLDRKRFIQPGQGLLLYVNVVGG